MIMGATLVIQTNQEERPGRQDVVDECQLPTGHLYGHCIPTTQHM